MIAEPSKLDGEDDPAERAAALQEWIDEYGEDSVILLTTLEFQFEQGLPPWNSPEQYVTEITATLLLTEENGIPEFEIGKVVALKVHRLRLYDDGASIHDICDDHSAELEEIARIFYGRHSEPRQKFNLESFGNLLVLWDFDIEPRFEHLKLAGKAFWNVIETFGVDCVMVAHRKLGLSVDEWKDLGFFAAPKTDYYVRDWAKANPYGRD
jgi:hypothetical protein